jgi:hypothetical protein
MMQPEEAKSSLKKVVSFASLGASVPFTSHRLLGARIRQAADGRGLELILVNPAQTKGSYVMSWRAVPDIGAPTLFDLRLWEVLSTLKEVHPTAIRRHALTVASEGMAGRLVASAGKKALAEEQRNEIALLTQFSAQLTGASPSSLTRQAPYHPDDLATIEAQRILETLDPTLTKSLRVLAETLSCVGPSNPTEMAPLIRLKKEIAAMLGGFRALLDQGEKDGEYRALHFLISATDTVLHYAELGSLEIETNLSDMVELLARPQINAANVLERARRLEWLLDGWGVLVALWHRTPTELRHTVAWDLTSLLPPLPREVHTWFSPDHTRTSPARLTRNTLQGTDWRSGRNLEITARNEGLIGFALNYENRMSEAGLRPATSRGRVRIDKYNAAGSRKSFNLDKNGPIPKQTSVEAEKNGGLGTDLSAASDENLLRIIAMIDRRPDRTKLEGLVIDIRPRLARLRPPRPVTMTRLLFLPLSGALVNRSAWRQDPATIPRAALKLIFALLHDLPGTHLTETEAAIQHAVFSDLAVVDRYGRPLWEAAARFCEKITPGSRWAEAGFSADEFRIMMRLAAGVWRHAGPLWDVLRRGTAPISADALRAALTGPASEGPDIFRAAFRTLLLASGDAAAFTPLTSGMPPGISEVVIQSLEEWIETALPKLAEQDLIEGASRAEEIGKTLDALGVVPFFQIPRRRQQLSAFFQQLEEHCRAMLLEITDQEILPALAPSLHAYSDDRFMMVENHARAARSLEILGRRFGNVPAYDEYQQRLVRAFASAEKMNSRLGITAMDLARLGEILFGHNKISGS